jgi:hypothetical protein
MRSRRFAAPAPALPLLALLALLAASGCEDNRVPETYPSGSTPAPVPKVDAKAAAAAKVPAAPPVEMPNIPPSDTAPAPGVGGENSGTAHLTLSGDHPVDLDTRVSCDLYAVHGFTLSFTDPKGPQVDVRIGEIPGTGTFTGAVLVRGAEQGTLRESTGTAQVQVTAMPTAKPRHGSVLSGQLSGSFAGSAGKGTVTARFDRCFFRGGPTP